MSDPMVRQLRTRDLGLIDYLPVWQAMQQVTERRGAETVDELWLLQHPPVFTQGQAGKAEHLLAPGDIPVVAVDRGGQVTYHGPGQLVVYLLLDLRRRNLGVRDLVTAIEQAIVQALAEYGVTAAARRDAPGVYVDGAKIASLGLRVRKGCSFHGLALNLDMELEPFARINPCGYAGMPVVRLCDLVADWQPGITEQVAERLVAALCNQLGYDKPTAAGGLPQSQI